MITLISIIFTLALQQQPDHSDKRCVVLNSVNGVSRSNCDGWSAPKGERMIVSLEVSKRLKQKMGNNILCTNTGEDREGILLTCQDSNHTREPFDYHIAISDWPPEWHGPELGFTYEIDMNGQPVSTDRVAWPKRQQAIRENQLRELRRWRIQPAQQVLK